MNTTPVNHNRYRTLNFNHECIVCGSKAVGINFGVSSCAPCKAFFRRNARRKDVLTLPCHHSDINPFDENNTDSNDMAMRYLQIRRCSSCRLRRCFEVGMKEELIRTDEENQRHRELVDNNRKRRETLQKQELERENQLSLTKHIPQNYDLISKTDWCHLSNIVYAFDTYCVKTYLEHRTNIFQNEISQKEKQLNHYKMLPMSITFALGSFLKELPAFQSLSRTNQLFLCKNNLRRLIFMNFHELNQACFSEPWQIDACKSIWEFICGPDLHKQFASIQISAEKLIITDPIMTRLWIIILFFSTPLFSYYDPKSTAIKVRKNSLFIDIQTIYVNLLWKYLLNRHGPMESIRIYSNLAFAFLSMLRIGLEVNIRLRTRKDLAPIHETLDDLVKLDINAD
ncbi:unnamed protein product [Rotaria socialis]|uniref:Nuclear receptor domain-containing protein n=1 Tax=Rotaria socialis TaxID=392032 RepID=A0A817YP50_9BILA|nr:unnamed protein product [Rotaria socialis]CAF4138821.1 unnamed protein product [Rotaria socialis]